MGEAARIELNVRGMTCVGCVAAVTRIIKRIDPTATVSADLAAGKVVATTVATRRALADAVTAGGYETQ